MTNCIQALDNGKPCNAPAVNGSKFCRHHDPQRPHKEVKETREIEPLVLPVLQDKPSILAALNQVVQALAEGRIKHSMAATLLSGIKLAFRLVTEISQSGESIPSGMAAAHRSRQPIAHLAASRDPRKAAGVFSSSQSTDRLVEELMAQSRELLAKSPRPDPRFMRT